MKRISIVLIVMLMAGCSGMQTHDSSGSGASSDDLYYRGGAGKYQKSPGERMTDPYDPWFTG